MALKKGFTAFSNMLCLNFAENQLLINKYLKLEKLAETLNSFMWIFTAMSYVVLAKRG